MCFCIRGRKLRASLVSLNHRNLFREEGISSGHWAKNLATFYLLPAAFGILLISGIVRKELTILMPAVIYQTTNFASALSPVQLIVLVLVTMIYILVWQRSYVLPRSSARRRASAPMLYHLYWKST